MTVDPKSVAPVNVYKLLTGSVVPRPIAFVSTVSLDGVLNLAPFSFFNAFSANPPVVGFSPSHTADSQSKDTLSNVRATGEFVVNIVSEEIAEQMNATSAPFPPEIDEFQAAGLTPMASEIVRPPRVRETRVSLECKLLQIVELSRLPMGGNLILGEVVLFHVDDEIVDDYRIDAGKLRAVGRMSGPTYTRTRDRFDMPRPTAAAVGAKGVPK